MPNSGRLPRLTVRLLNLKVVLTVLTLATVAWTLYDARDAARLQAEQEAGNIATALERDIVRMVSTLDLSLRAAAKGMGTPGFATLDPAIRQAILFVGNVEAPDVGGMFITDEAGRVIYRSPRAVGGPTDIADRPLFRRHRDHRDLGLLISHPMRLLSDGKLGIALVRRIDHQDGTFAGVAVAILHLSYFQSLFSGIELGKHGALNLVSSDGALIARQPYREADVGIDLSASRMFGYLAHSPAGNFVATARIDGITRLYHYQQVAGLPFVVGVGISLQAVYAEWTRKAAIVGGAVLLFSALGLSLVWRFQQELRRRMRAEGAARRALAMAEQLRRDLAAALAPLDTLFRNSPDTMLVARQSSDGSFVYEAVNPLWETLVGLAPGAAIGRTPQACLPPETAAKVVEAWQECVRERRLVTLSLEFPAESGRAWDVVVLPIPDEDGTVGRLIIVGREMTERVRLEAKLRQAQKMEVIGQLAAGVAHDFNNILQVIGGGLEVLRDEKAVSPGGRKFVDMSGAAVRRGAYLTQHLLSYARKQIHNPKPIDLCEIVESLQMVLSRTLGSHIALSVEVASDVGVVRADRGQLETALINLAINAGHAMPDGGSLCFEVSSAEGAAFGDLEDVRHAVIAVTDTGTGMEPAVMAKVFEPFFTTKGHFGTGLGLAMVHGFCRQSGGDVRVMSTPGRGTRFELWLPESAEALPQPQEMRRLPAQPARVLLVDDVADVMLVAEAFLRRGGYTVIQAVGGRQALDKFAAGERFDVLITDYMMPDINGADLIRQARVFQPGLPAVVISGFSDVTDLVNDLPDITLMLKPFRREDLLSTVAAALAGDPVGARTTVWPDPAGK